jgi:hypothetical protein
MTGGTALSHSFNLKNCTNYNLEFLGGWTHSETGARPNGINAYAKTNLSRASGEFNFEGSVGNKHLSYYARTAPTIETVLMGAMYLPTDREILVPNATGFGSQMLGSVSSPTISQIASHYIISKTGNTEKCYLKNEQQTVLFNNGVGALVDTFQFYLGALNYQNSFSFFYFTDAECAFSSIGVSLSLQESLVFTEIVKDYQTTLNRLP